MKESGAACKHASLVSGFYAQALPGVDRAEPFGKICFDIDISHVHLRFWCRRRSALPMTEIDDRLIAAAANIGFNSQPVSG